MPVDDEKVVKNRVHLDLLPDAARDVAADEVLGLGATLVADHRKADGTGWAVLADPAGNEFCIERSGAERGLAAPVETPERDRAHMRTVGERQILEAMLAWYRVGVVEKVAGVSAHDATTSPLRTGTTIAGLVKHLALVEDSWFHTRFAGHPEPEPWASAPWGEDRDWEFHSAADEPMADLVALYREACERSRAATAGRDLDEEVPHPLGTQVKLRYIYVHMIEETARRLGHLDVLREYMDGTTGE